MPGATARPMQAEAQAGLPSRTNLGPIELGPTSGEQLNMGPSQRQLGISPPLLTNVLLAKEKPVPGDWVSGCPKLQYPVPFARFIRNFR